MPSGINVDATERQPIPPWVSIDHAFRKFVEEHAPDAMDSDWTITSAKAHRAVLQAIDDLSATMKRNEQILAFDAEITEQIEQGREVKIVQHYTARRHVENGPALSVSVRVPESHDWRELNTDAGGWEKTDPEPIESLTKAVRRISDSIPSRQREGVKQ